MGFEKKCPTCGRIVAGSSTSEQRRLYKSEYNIWCSIIQRCGNPNHKKYEEYKNRGMCDRWRWSFNNFLIDMGPRPSRVHSIERINNDKGYNPKNCKWATPKEQANNRRSNRRISFEGKEFSLEELSKKYNIPITTLKNRVNSGQTGSYLVRPKNEAKSYPYKGNFYKISELMKITGLSKHVLMSRLNEQNMTVEEALLAPSDKDRRLDRKRMISGTYVIKDKEGKDVTLEQLSLKRRIFCLALIKRIKFLFSIGVREDQITENSLFRLESRKNLFYLENYYSLNELCLVRKISKSHLFKKIKEMGVEKAMETPLIGEVASYSLKKQRNVFIDPNQPPYLKENPLEANKLIWVPNLLRTD